MKRKTYGVSNLMDWTAQIKVGKASMSVHFTGGALTAYGVTEATYSTTNPVFQHAIENSAYFKSGRIKLMSAMEVPDDEGTKARKERAARKAANNTLAEETPAAPPADAGTAAGAVTTVEVADKNEAIEYLKEHFKASYTATSLRTKAAFDAACEECGVQFVFTAE